MDVTYGQGIYIEGKARIQGQIILGEHKLYLKGPDGELTSTFIPLEKIVLIKKVSRGLHIEARPTIHLRVTSLIAGDKKLILELAQEIASRRGFKKKFLKNEWVEVF